MFGFGSLFGKNSNNSDDDWFISNDPEGLLDAPEIKLKSESEIHRDRDRVSDRTLREFKPGLTYVDLENGTYRHFDDENESDLNEDEV